MINGYFKFFPVGQGLFYGGCISTNIDSSFTFVYDCGTEDRWEPYLNKAINNFSSLVSDYRDFEINHIDLIVISHLHKDHFSGVYRLIKQISQPNRIILPLIEGDIFEKEMSLFALFLDDNLSNNIEAFRFFSKLYLDAVTLTSNEQSFLFSNGDNNHQEIKSYVLSNNDASFLLKDSSSEEIWKFIFIRGSIGRNNELIINDIKDDLKDLLTKDNCDTISEYIDLKGNGGLEDIRGIYQKHGIKSSYSENNTSTIMLHHPIAECGYSDALYYIHFFNWCERVMAVTMLTGDSKITKKQSEIIIDYLSDLEPCCLITQLPHHGSKTNFFALYKYLWTYIINGISIVSFGLGNIYNHPNKETVRSFSINQLIKVNEYRDFSYRLS